MSNMLSAIGSYLFLPISLVLLMWFLKTKKGRVDVQGKVVLITGASSGLGKACAKLFYKAGAKVILAARNVDALQNVKQELISLKSAGEKYYMPEVVEMDLADFKSVSNAAQKALSFHGNIHILINNAGMSYRGEILETTMDVQTKLMAVNYFGHVALTKAILPSMIDQQEGYIVAVSSVQGKLSVPFRSAYSASKHATQAFFDCLRAEVAHHNIKVCVVSPGYIRTNLSLNAMTNDGSPYAVMDETTRTGMAPEDVGSSILRAVQNNSVQVMPASFTVRLAVYLNNIFPSLMALIMRKRASKQRKLTSKEK